MSWRDWAAIALTLAVWVGVFLWWCNAPPDNMVRAACVGVFVLLGSILMGVPLWTSWEAGDAVDHALLAIVAVLLF